MLIKVGDVVEGKVSGVTNFGAFVQLPDGKVGLVHISEVAGEYVKDVSTYLSINQSVKVKVLSVDKNGKTSLSIKKALPPSEVYSKPADVDRNRNNKNNKNNIDNGQCFEDRLAKFIKDSDEKLHDLKKNFESKRGSGSWKRSSQG